MHCLPLEAKSHRPISVLILPDSQATFEELNSPVLDMCSSLGFRETTILLVAPFHLLADSSSCSQPPHFWGTPGSALNPFLCFLTHSFPCWFHQGLWLLTPHIMSTTYSLDPSSGLPICLSNYLLIVPLGRANLTWPKVSASSLLPKPAPPGISPCQLMAAPFSQLLRSNPCPVTQVKTTLLSTVEPPDKGNLNSWMDHSCCSRLDYLPLECYTTTKKF